MEHSLVAQRRMLACTYVIMIVLKETSLSTLTCPAPAASAATFQWQIKFWKIGGKDCLDGPAFGFGHPEESFMDWDRLDRVRAWSTCAAVWSVDSSHDLASGASV
jgi:hypothetical protein